VPPQVIGKNINSERLASSNRLTERAIVGFRSLITRIRDILAGIMREATITPKGRYIGYSVVLHTYELNELLPVLHEDAIVKMMADTYDIDPKLIDKRKAIEAAHVGAAENAPHGPGSKKPRTETQAIAADKQRGNAAR